MSDKSIAPIRGRGHNKWAYECRNVNLRAFTNFTRINSVIEQYNLVLPAKGGVRGDGLRLCTEVTAGLAESNGSLPPGYWLGHLRADCSAPGSAPEPTLVQWLK